MKFEKRGDASPDIENSSEETASTPAEESPAQPGATPSSSASNKSVLRYLVILFAVAFGLILFSFVMHQRSNAEVLNKLQSQVDTIERLQQIEVEYANLKDENSTLQNDIDSLTEKLAAADKQQQAITLLWKLQALYTAQDSAGCTAAMEALKKDELYLSLPTKPIAESDTYESPYAAYERISQEISKN